MLFNEKVVIHPDIAFAFYTNSRTLCADQTPVVCLDKLSKSCIVKRSLVALRDTHLNRDSFETSTNCLLNINIEVRIFFARYLKVKEYSRDHVFVITSILLRILDTSVKGDFGCPHRFSLGKGYFLSRFKDISS